MGMTAPATGKPDFWDKTWDAAISVVQTVAPTIATVLGGPLAGTAVQALSTALFGTPDKSPAEVAGVINAGMNPDQLMAMTKQDEQFKLDMERCKIDLVKIEADDRANARSMQIAAKDPMVNVIALGTVIGFFVIIVLVLLGYAKIEGALAGTLVGYVAAKASDVYHFLFGSSASSQNKDNLLAQSSPNT